MGYEPNRSRWYHYGTLLIIVAKVLIWDLLILKAWPLVLTVGIAGVYFFVPGVPAVFEEYKAFITAIGGGVLFLGGAVLWGIQAQRSHGMLGFLCMFLGLFFLLYFAATNIERIINALRT